MVMVKRARFILGRILCQRVKLVKGDSLQNVDRVYLLESETGYSARNGREQPVPIQLLSDVTCKNRGWL